MISASFILRLTKVSEIITQKMSSFELLPEKKTESYPLRIDFLKYLFLKIILCLSE